MVIDLDAKEYAVLRIALADLIKKCNENKEAVTLTDVKCWDVYNRYDDNLKVATTLFNKLS
jgi:hypothetical protein